MNYLYSLIQGVIVGVLMLLFLLFALSKAYADANDGEYLGYRLGAEFEPPRKAESRQHITGARIFDQAPGTHPHHMDTITLYVSPTSSIIGSILGEWYFARQRAAAVFADRYLAQLAEKYPHWKLSGRSLSNGSYQLWVEVEQRPYIEDYWPSRHDYRVGVGLIYAPDSVRRGEWMAMIDAEINKREKFSAKR